MLSFVTSDMAATHSAAGKVVEETFNNRIVCIYSYSIHDQSNVNNEVLFHPNGVNR